MLFWKLFPQTIITNSEERTSVSKIVRGAGFRGCLLDYDYKVYKINMRAADIRLHSQTAYWERSHQGSWEHSQLAWSEHYTI